ncbi:monocarboxylate transporter 12-like isoform X4 [Ptychodera flava]|uniref:monocarboxylate transporter 12-like isoform X4 n=1 Tax=Ptychodera flava TaxID=63121 RepID=UPI00396A3D56
MATGTSKTTAPDGGWGWFIVIATFISTILSAGNCYSFGVLFVAFLDAFGGTKSETGFGVGLSYMPCIDMTGKYFKKKLSLALGLGMAGTGAGQFLLSLGNQLLVDTYGWRGMLLILSAFSLHLCVAGALLRPLQTYQPIPSKETALKEGEHGIDIDTMGQGATLSGCTTSSADEIAMSERERSEKENGRACRFSQRRCAAFLTSLLTSMYDKELLTQPVFLLQLLICIGQPIGHSTVCAHVVRRFRDFGIPATKSALVVSFMGIGQLIGRPLSGAIANSGLVKPHVLYGIAMAICGVLNVFGMYVESFQAQLFYITVFGICMGGYLLLTPVVVNYFHGKDKIPHGTSMVIQGQGVAALLVSPLAGYMRDKYGGYEQAFWVVVGAYAVCTACAFSLGAVDTYFGRRSRRQADTITRTISEAGNLETLVLSEYVSTV